MALKVLILGGTGGTGREVVKKILKPGHNLENVRLLVRSMASVVTAFGGDAKTMLDDKRVSVVEGDVLDEGLVTKAVEDVDVVVFCISTKRLSWHVSDLGRNPRDLEVRGLSNVIRAVKAKASRCHIIFVSAVGVTRAFHFSTIMLNIIVGWVMRYKVACELLLLQSGVDFTIIRPGGLTNKEATGVTLGQGDKLKGMPPVSRKLVADLVVECAFRDPMKGMVFEVQGAPVQKCATGDSSNVQPLLSEPNWREELSALRPIEPVSAALKLASVKPWHGRVVALCTLPVVALVAGVTYALLR
eukprot:jgi/Mesvir1/22369/Mv17870-RA.1